MKVIVNLSIVAAAICLVVGVISRVTLQPIGAMQIQAHALLQLTNTFLLVAILLSVKQKT